MASSETDKIKLEDHHPEMMKYSAETRRIINAYNGFGVAGPSKAGWEAVNAEMSDISDERFMAGQLAERSNG